MTNRSAAFQTVVRELTEAQQAVASLEAELLALSFDPHDPLSLRAALQRMERTLDKTLQKYRKTPLVDEYIEATKAAYRERLLTAAVQQMHGTL